MPGLPGVGVKEMFVLSVRCLTFGVVTPIEAPQPSAGSNFFM
jgi:hypothetical protein